jgi:nitrogen fixation NifU-like protein
MQLDDLYRQVIMDHYTHPRNSGTLTADSISVDVRNPTCGDEITLQLQIEDGIVKDVRFKGTGCSISMASASMMSEAIKGKPVTEALHLSKEFRRLMKGEEVDPDLLGEIESLAGVSKFPARIKCATLAWNALDRGSEGRSQAAEIDGE